MSVNRVYPGASAVTQALEVRESEVAEAASIHFIFNHFSKQKTDGPPRQRMNHAFASSVSHAARRINLLNGYESAFFPKGENYDRSAMVIAVLCSPFLKEGSRIKNLNTADTHPCITDEAVRRAYGFQEEAIAIKKTADLDYKGPRGNNDGFTKEAYFLACINLLEKMYTIECSDVTYESLSDHLRYDLICAPKYVNRNTVFGSVVADTIDKMEDKIVAQLEPFTRVHVAIRKADGPKLNFR